MTTATATTGASFVQAADLLATHLTEHQLPPPASLTVLTREDGHCELTVQLCSCTLSGLAADLLTWADTLTTTITTAVWRPPRGELVHLSLTSTLAGQVGTVELEVFGGASYHPTVFADLAPGERRRATLAHLRTWASSASTHTDTPLLDLHWGQR
jgi:hypothetical protein